MPKGIYNVPTAVNEPIFSYAPGSPERAELQATIKEMRSKQIDVLCTSVAKRFAQETYLR